MLQPSGLISLNSFVLSIIPGSLGVESDPGVQGLCPRRCICEGLSAVMGGKNLPQEPARTEEPA